MARRATTQIYVPTSIRFTAETAAWLEKRALEQHRSINQTVVLIVDAARQGVESQDAGQEKAVFHWRDDQCASV